MGQGSTEGCNN